MLFCKIVKLTEVEYGNKVNIMYRSSMIIEQVSW